MSYCKNCSCKSCEKRRNSAEREIIERREIEQRIKERNKEHEKKWESTIEENHFGDVQFQHGFRVKKFEHVRLGVRLANVLYQNDLHTVDQVLQFSEKRFMRLKNMGKVAFFELIAFLKTGVKAGE